MNNIIKGLFNLNYHQNTGLEIGLVHVPTNLKFFQSEIRRMQSARALFLQTRQVDLQRMVSLLNSYGISQNNIGFLKDLEHPLSHAAVSKLGPAEFWKYQKNVRCHSSLREYNIMMLTFRSLLLSISNKNYSSFIEVLKLICGHCCQRPTNFRDNQVSTSNDLKGDHWIFPSSIYIDEILNDLFIYLCNENYCTLVRAVVAHVVICLVHPFNNGNGRTGRIVFNSILVDDPNCLLPNYIPCSELFARSRLGYQVCLRSVHVLGDWKSIIEFFTKVIIAYTKLNKNLLVFKGSKCSRNLAGNVGRAV